MLRMQAVREQREGMQALQNLARQAAMSNAERDLLYSVVTACFFEAGRDNERPLSEIVRECRPELLEGR
jgi:hypothetical protein